MYFKDSQGENDLTVLNTIYHKPYKDPETNKWTNGAMTIVAKDNTNGMKQHDIIEDPDFTFYMAKEEVPVDNNLFFIKQDKVDPVTVKYRNLEKEIAGKIGCTELFYDNISNGNRYANKMFHTHPRIFRSDMHIEDYYRYEFSKRFTNNVQPVTKGYLDIEVNGKYMMGTFPELGECPINAVSTYCSSTKTMYTFLLREKDNPLIKEFEDGLDNRFFDELTAMIIKAVGGIKKFKKLKLDEIQYKIMFYDEEIKLIHDLFRLINTLQPDFMLAWNMAFDIPYIIERIKTLGYNPEDIMCHPDFKYKEAWYWVDERNKNSFAERTDYATISCYTVYLDQMLQFASRRKGQSQFDSLRLDDIGFIIAGFRKLDYKHITTDITEFPYLDYKLFVMYNIIDVLVQIAIENTVEDIDYVFTKSVANNTRYAKLHRQTVYLANRATINFEQQGFIIGNNNNKNNEKPPKFPGAFVADPKMLSDKSKVKINGTPVNMFRNADDYDYARLYPSILQEFNEAPNTQIGMIHIDEKIHNLENRSREEEERYSRGGEFLENLASHNYLDICSRWFQMASYEELYDDVVAYYSDKQTMFPLFTVNENGLLASPVKKCHGELPKAVIHEDKSIGMRKAVFRHDPFTDSMKERLDNEYRKFKS